MDKLCPHIYTQLNKRQKWYVCWSTFGVHNMTKKKIVFSSLIKQIDKTMVLASKESQSFYVENYGLIFHAYNLKSKYLKRKRLSKKEISRLENQRKEKEYQRGTFKKNMRALAILLVFGIFTGSGLGVWYFNSVLKSNVNYLQYNVEEYLPEYNSTFVKLGIRNESDWDSFVEVAKQNQITPLSSSLNALDNYLLALYNAERATSYSAIGIGNVATIASQDIYSAKYFDGNTYSFESISVGILQVATKDEMDANSNMVTISNGSSVKQNENGSMSANWQESERITSQQYKELTGNYLDTINPYIISEQTILNLDSVQIVDNGDGTYSFTLELHPIYSVLNYYKQVKRSGALEADPTFTSITQIVTIDQNWNFVSFDTTENYTAVKFSMGAKCTGTLYTELEFNI